MLRPLLVLSCALLVFGSASAFAQLDPALDRAPQAREGTLSQPDLGLARGGGLADLAWSWDNDPRWIRGRDFGGETFFGSISRGRYFNGSTIGFSEDVPVEIVFSTEETSFAQVYRRDQGYAPVGVGTFPGAVYDVSDPENPRRLNVGISEDNRLQPANMTWDPDDSGSGAREYLWIMGTDYDGTGTTYENVNILNGGNSLPILYVWESRLEPGRTLFETEPATLSIDLAFITDLDAVPGNGEVTLTWDYDAPPEADGLVVYQGPTAPATEPVAIIPPTQTSLFIEGLNPDLTYYFRLEALDDESNVIDISAEVRTKPLISRNMELVGNLNPASSYGDVWGWVDPDTGREYALLCGRFSGLYIIDVTDETPVEVGFVSGVADSKDVKTYGKYAYLVNENAPIQIIDLEDPASPSQVGTLNTGGSDGGSHNILIDGDYLYVIGGRSPGGLRIYSLADPTAPSFVGGVAGTNGQTYYHDVDIVGDILYGAAIYDEGIDIIDISDKSNPTVISTFIYPAVYMGAHNICATEDGDYVLVGDEIGSEPHTRVFDVRDPFDVELVADIIVDPGSPVHNCYVEGDLAYIAHYNEGVRVYDVSTPSAPVEAALYDTFPGAVQGFVGNWTVYPYLPSGKIIASDMQTGLYVLRFTNGVSTEPTTTPEAAFALGAPYPNPTAGLSTVPLTLKKATQVRLAVYDVLGREVIVLVDGPLETGPHALSFDANRWPAGAYFVRLQTDGTERAVSRPFTIVR